MEIKISFPGGKKVEAEVNSFKITTDQPESRGGDNSAPSPFVQFLASIGTCTGFFVLSFCQKRNIPTDNITLMLHIVRNEDTHMVEHIEININVPKQFPENYRNALLKTASICTVKKHLEKPPTITMQVVTT